MSPSPHPGGGGGGNVNYDHDVLIVCRTQVCLYDGTTCCNMEAPDQSIEASTSQAPAISGATTRIRAPVFEGTYVYMYL